jgi:hypothetical protein
LYKEEALYVKEGNSSLGRTDIGCKIIIPKNIHILAFHKAEILLVLLGYSVEKRERKRERKNSLI